MKAWWQEWRAFIRVGLPFILFNATLVVLVLPIAPFVLLWEDFPTTKKEQSS